MILVKVPLENGLGKTKGCGKAPDQILEIMKENFSSESGKKIAFSIQEIEIDNENLQTANETIQKEASKIFNKNERIVFIGGDHSLSYNLVKEFSKHKNCGIIVFDAHPDCMAPGKEPNHEEWLRAVIEQGFDTKKVILVGIRNSDPEEIRFLEKKHVNVFSMKEINEDIERSCDKIMEEARKFDSLYLSLDIDIVDPAFAPGTGYIEPGGLTSRQFLYLIQRISLLNNLKAIDLVEVNPEKDLNRITVKLAAKIIAELI